MGRETEETSKRTKRVDGNQESLWTQMTELPRDQKFGEGEQSPGPGLEPIRVGGGGRDAGRNSQGLNE